MSPRWFEKYIKRPERTNKQHHRLTRASLKTHRFDRRSPVEAACTPHMLELERGVERQNRVRDAAWARPFRLLDASSSRNRRELWTPCPANWRPSLPPSAPLPRNKTSRSGSYSRHFCCPCCCVHWWLGACPAGVTVGNQLEAAIEARSSHTASCGHHRPLARAVLR